MKSWLAFVAGSAFANAGSASDKGDGFLAVVHMVAMLCFTGLWLWVNKQEKIEAASVTAHGEGK